tara:strand:- start:702 stop:890 length:189 start_codon:yes stop_codon:yes gene_type:complete
MTFNVLGTKRSTNMTIVRVEAESFEDAKEEVPRKGDILIATASRVVRQRTPNRLGVYDIAVR